MESDKSLPENNKPRTFSKSSITIGLIIFILGIIAGVVGLCVAFKVIFYIGLAVAIIAAIALVWCIITVRRK